MEGSPLSFTTTSIPQLRDSPETGKRAGSNRIKVIKVNHAGSGKRKRRWQGECGGIGEGSLEREKGV
jgi:hypothetical protein